MIVLWLAVLSLNCAAQAGPLGFKAAGFVPQQTPQQSLPPATVGGTGYEGRNVQSVDVPGASPRDRQHLLELLPQKAGTPLDREQVRESIRVLYGTGRFADIEAEVTPSSDGVQLRFMTSPNFFVGAVNVEGAPSRPTANQIVNSAKLVLGELFTREKLNRALENIRQLMLENGFYKARVTVESTTNVENQQAAILFHVSPGSQAHVGMVTVTGTSTLAPIEVQRLAHMNPGERVTASRVSDSLQRLRKRFQKQNRALAQVSIVAQNYHPETNALDFRFQIDPGPVVLISARGYHISRGTLKKQIPVYEENAVDDDLLNEGRRNLLDYMQTRGHFDASVDIKKETDEKTMRVIYEIEPGPIHKLELVRITGTRIFWTPPSCVHTCRFNRRTVS
jgi:Outer membrane protein/protective antigen OMA87